MKIPRFSSLLLLAVVWTAAATFLVGGDAADRDWPNWRGPLHSGVSPHGDPPLHWSETKNIRFKIAVPGRGLASPVVWKDRIFLLTAVADDDKAYAESLQAAADKSEFPPAVRPVKHQFVVLAYSRTDGRLLWTRTAAESVPHETHHLDASWASASPVTDGKRLIAHFGSNGTYAYDLDGKLLWKTDLGDMTTRRGFGEGSSPALHGNTVVITWDHEGDSFLVALDANTGELRWKVDRPDEATSWATPLIVAHGGRQQVVVPATGYSRGHDLETGKELWRIAGMTTNVIPTPVHRDGVVYLASGFRGNMLQAVALSRAKGDLKGTDALVWSHDKDTPYVPSPLLYDDSIYFLKRLSNILTQLDADDGKIRYSQVRLPGLGDVWASPVGAAGRVYIFDRNGHAVVLKHGAKFEVLAENALEEGTDATPAIVGRELFVRTQRHLYCIAADTSKANRPVGTK